MLFYLYSTFKNIETVARQNSLRQYKKKFKAKQTRMVTHTLLGDA